MGVFPHTTGSVPPACHLEPAVIGTGDDFWFPIWLFYDVTAGSETTVISIADGRDIGLL